MELQVKNLVKIKDSIMTGLKINLSFDFVIDRLGNLNMN